MEHEEDEVSGEVIHPVLQGTSNGRLHTFHTAVKNPENTGARVSVSRIPKRIEALFILLADDKDVGGSLLTREELDINPRTAELTRREKDALVKYWPKFIENVAIARELKNAREQETAYAIKSNVKGAQLRRKQGADEMPLAEQAEIVARLLGKKAIDGAFGMAATGVEDIHTDPLAKELYATRTEYVRHYMGIASRLLDLGEKLRRTGDPTREQSTLPDEALEALRAANEALAGRKAG